MAELLMKDETYRNVPVYECFDYIANNNGFVYLSPVWTTSGLLIPIAHSDVYIVCFILPYYRIFFKSV